MENAPIITINGYTVANFSSPHAFVFDNGDVLPACDVQRSQLLSMDKNSNEIDHVRGFRVSKVSFYLTGAIIDEMENLKDIDVVLVPFPMLEKVKERYDNVYTVLMVDRISKISSSSVFCR